MAAERLVRQAVIREKVLIEKVAERSVPHVVQQGRHAEQRFDAGPAGYIGAYLAEAVVQPLGCPAGQMHGPQHVLKPRVLSRGEDPPGSLQLVNVSQPLEPGMVDELPFAGLARLGVTDERDVAMQRIVAQALAVEVVHRGDYIALPGNGGKASGGGPRSRVVSR